MKVRLYSTFVLLLLVLSAQAQKFDYTYQNVNFTCKLSKGTVTVTSFSNKASRVVIPSTVAYRGAQYPVKSVDVFLNGVNYLAEELVLEEGIEDVAKFAFNEFRKLRSIVLPSTLKHIGRNAVRNNSGMVMQLAYNIDEAAVRNGKETWPMAGVAAPAYQPLVARKQEKAEKSKEPNVTSTQTSKAKSKEAAKEAAKAMYMAKESARKADKKARNTKQEQPATPKAEVAEVPQPAPVKQQVAVVDVDVNIPTSAVKNEDTYCVIIANEHYVEVPDVEYAKRDGEVFREYCTKTLGIPEKNIKTFTDATYTAIRRAVSWMGTTANVTGGRSKMIFYYAGHGIPGEQDKMAYLLPTDGMPKDMETCYKLSELYNRLGRINVQSVTVLLDACFSGMKRGESQPLVAARAVAIETKRETLSGNVVVISATSGDETALAYQEKRHGMFTYFLLDKLRQTKGRVSLGELFESVSSAVKKNSWLENEKLQTPSVNVSLKMKNKWKELRF